LKFGACHLSEGERCEDVYHNEYQESNPNVMVSAGRDFPPEVEPCFGATTVKKALPNPTHNNAF